MSSPRIRPPVHVIDLPPGGQVITVIATVCEPPASWRLIGLDARGRHYVARQDASGMVSLLAGPTTAHEALAAACRVLAGREQSVTGDGLAVAGALIAGALHRQAAAHLSVAREEG